MQSPVWMALGQHKYVNIWYGQQETLYRNYPFSKLQEVRINRVMRRCARKNCVAHDEFLEHGNRFFSEFLMPRSLEGFVSQSVYVGVGLQSKEFSDMWYTTRFKGDDKKSYNKSVAWGN